MGEMDAHGRFNPGSNANSSGKFANNTHYWPMKVIVDCPLSTTAERTLVEMPSIISGRRREMR